MDGFHYYKYQLDEFPDSVLAYKRRGAHWTFDADKFVNRLKFTKSAGSGSFPSFDHSNGDPVEDDILIGSSDEVIIIEGLYLLLNISPWDEIKSLCDLNIFIQCPEEVLIARLCDRHMKTLKLSEHDALTRAVTNDIPNSVEIIESSSNADLIINSDS